jgi:hypothetical protein
VSTIASGAVSAIDWYQRRVSPHKGFCCAYRVKWGGDSCSMAVKRAFLIGAWSGVREMFAQSQRCYAASRMLAAESQPKGNTPEQQDRENFCAQWAAMEGAWWCCFLPFTIS